MRGPEGLPSRWYVRLAEGSLSGGELLKRSGAPAGERAYLTPALTRPALEEQLAGQKVLSIIRVLD